MTKIMKGGIEYVASPSTAAHVAYSNTSSGLSATNVQSAIDEVYGVFGTLDGVITGSPSTSKTLTVFSETDGIVTATFGDISITKSQVSDFPASESAVSGGTTLSLVTTGEKYTWNNKSDLTIGTTATTASAGNHKHGNINNDGTIANFTTIGDTDGIVFADSSDNHKIKRSIISFDTSVTNKCLTQAGTWATFGTSNLAIGTTASTAAAGNHAHGSITNAGAITGTTALASGDGIIFADSSDSSKLKRSSITFDGSTSTKCLTQAGTWASFTNNAGTVTGSGTANYLAKWSSGSAIGNALAYSSGSATAVRCNILNGGYITLGSYVFLDICFTLTSAVNNSASIVSGLPTPKYNSNISIVGTVLGDAQESTYGFRVVSGSLYANGNRSNGGGWHVFGSYVKA